MAQILTQDPGSNEAQSPLIVGITEGLNKLSSILNLKTSKLEDVSLTAVSIDDTEDNKNRIFEAPTGNRLWLSSPAPTFKKNGSPITQESSGFTIDYVGGSITFQKESKPSDGDTITVSATYIIAESEQLESILSGLSSAQTQANKYKGNYASYDSLILDIPSGKNGDFAIVFDPLAVYAWKNDGWYDTRSIEDLSNYYTKEEANNLINQKEPSITQKGSSSSDDNYYWGGRKTWQDLFAKVRSVTLTGLSTASDAVVSATDTVLVAIGKLQAQVSKATQRAYLSGTGAPTTSTVGAIGQRYINTSNGDEYTCEAISGDTYTWRMHTRSVNGKTPNSPGGNIDLTAKDVGAATPQQIPNPNVLDNSDFINLVNQRGKTEYTDGYTIDRWKLGVSGPRLTVLPGVGIRLSDADATYGAPLIQLFDSGVIDEDEVYTFSVCGTDKEVYSVSGRFTENAEQTTPWGKLLLTKYTDGPAVQIGVAYGSTHAFRWAKLEKGSVATPWQSKGYGSELAECQRYFCRVSTSLAEAVGVVSEQYRLLYFLPNSMRIVPTISNLVKWAPETPLPGFVARSNREVLFYSSVIWGIKGFDASADL